jgi:hypothetical protein
MYDIKKISMYLAWKLPPYYWNSNLRSFTKALRSFAKEEFTNDEMIFIQTQAKWIDEKVYFMVLDDLYKNKNDIIGIFEKLNIPKELYINTIRI